DGSPSLVRIDHVAVQPAVLVEVTSHLDARCITQAAHLHGVETSGGDEVLNGSRSALVVRRIEQGCGPRRSIRARGERLGAKRAKSLHKMSVVGEETRDHGRSGLSLGKRSTEPALAVELDRIRRVDDDLAVEQISV